MKECVQYLTSLRYIQVVEWFPKIIRVDEVFQICVGSTGRLKLVTYENQQQGNGRDSLLAIYEVVPPATLRRDYGTEKVSLVGTDRLSVISGAVGGEELIRQVIEKLNDVFLTPLVFTLILINGELLALKEIKHVFVYRSDFSHDCSLSTLGVVDGGHNEIVPRRTFPLNHSNSIPSETRRVFTWALGSFGNSTARSTLFLGMNVNR